ncbi:hypothetical protein GCM10020256_02300 [Streptomyces thermocoprophilus]
MESVNEPAIARAAWSSAAVTADAGDDGAGAAAVAAVAGQGGQRLADAQGDQGRGGGAEAAAAGGDGVSRGSVLLGEWSKSHGQMEPAHASMRVDRGAQNKNDGDMTVEQEGI